MIKAIFMVIFAFFMLQRPLLAQQTDNILYIEQAIKIAQENDPWIDGNIHMQDSTKSLSVAAGSLPDPQISLGIANLPTDSFSFNQESMTQIKLGVSQMFPQGDSLKIKRQQLEIQADEFPYQRRDRNAKVAIIVGQLWLDAYKAKTSIALVEKNRSLFEQLTDIATSNYSSTMGRTRQQDIIRAQLELTRLNDRVTKLSQSQGMYMEKLAEWLNIQGQVHTFSIADKLPNIAAQYPELTGEELYDKLSNHPLMRALEQKIKSSSAGVDLAKQKYKPAWGLSASYGRRGSDPFGNGRADGVSVGVTLSVPLFTANRQDREYRSAISKREATRTEKWQLLRNLKAGLETARVQLARFNEREQIFENELLPQMSEQAEASLTAYTNDDGDFAEVVRARIAELNAEIDALNISVDKQKTIIQLNYFFTESLTERAYSGDMK